MSNNVIADSHSSLFVSLIALLDAWQQGAFGHDGKNFGPSSFEDDSKNQVRRETNVHGV